MDATTFKFWNQTEKDEKSKGYWWLHKEQKRIEPPTPPTEEPADEGVVTGVSEIFKNLLRGKKEGK